MLAKKALIWRFSFIVLQAAERRTEHAERILKYSSFIIPHSSLSNYLFATPKRTAIPSLFRAKIYQIRPFEMYIDRKSTRNRA
ncbi:hypothetical protein M2459_000533 [Parabacteroides sp. PF5-5]|uniref:hypothetical protein n=1 Tax=unclassified Parabacteroides TaxID=2649774 RepID=UPI0024759B4D|nr:MULTISPECIES: hypothetical protein [unclassified Parabacteroides]MDH6321875.1 hypothetical protein [Parabacteroides sp. PH5-8]MDH6325999.1 hypothetical protein [Parabacteroides sp. PH5-41]MDH6333799.1 hypothetical protein [Parabacteroides sp. PF5-5]MDH6344864.1 hypothetical protein [Parabacteroides sp. PH5-46]MDH6359866.1 hypothetical protein [Parabacteroides sp. PH5-16]